ncbi:hypothetical protein OPQ81_005315 [Rhizoctonia solani]|nr:hypothetical protein OPQ81_005315 [Rhizoctonia solani]
MPAPPPIVFTPSSASKHQRAPMNFTATWGEGDMFTWYGRRRQQSEHCIVLEKLQIRIDSAGPVPHRFVLALMKDKSIIRFDRRPETGKVCTLINETLGPAEYRKAGDDFCNLSPGEFSKLEDTTQCEIEINLPDGTDLLLVLSAAFAIANDEETRNYNLATFNCFFFSWTIIMIVARHAIPFTIPPPEKVIELLVPAVTELSSALTKKIVDALLSLVLDTITTFRSKTGRSLHKGLSKRELMIWGLPTSTVRFLLKGCLKMRLTFGLEDHMREIMDGQLKKHMGPLLAEVLTSQGPTNDNVEKQLWVDHLRDAFGPPVRRQLLRIVWTALLDSLLAIARCDDLNTKEIFEHIETDPRVTLIFRLKYRLLGPNVVQFTRVWNEGLRDALPAASKILDRENGILSDPAFTSDNLDDERNMHRRMFDSAFKAASDAALEAAKRVVGETVSKNRKRDEMWETVWEVWPDVWGSTQGKAENMVVDLITETMSEIVDLVAMNVVVAVGSDRTRPVQAVAHHRVS